MKPSDPRLIFLAKQANVRTTHVYHCWHSIAENPRAFCPDSFALFAGLERRHVDRIMAVLAENELLPARKAREPTDDRGTRLPAAMELPEEWLTFAQATRYWTRGVVEIEFQTFLDYWHAQPGSRGVKLRWESTWRNWVRRSHTPDGTWRPYRDAPAAPVVSIRPELEPQEICTPAQAREIIEEMKLDSGPFASLARSFAK